MKKTNRYRLHFGPYAAPRFRYGRKVNCEVRGEVIIAGLSNAKIPWPTGRLVGKSPRGLVIYKGLLNALRNEPATAVSYWWGVHVTTVSCWRNALGIEPDTAGSRELRREQGKRNWPKVKPKIRTTLHDPQRAEKIAAAKRGKPRPPHVIEAMREVNAGRKLSADHRRKLSKSHLRSRAESPRTDQWTDEHDALVRTLPAVEAAKRTGRTLRAVYVRRSRLGINEGRSR